MHFIRNFIITIYNSNYKYYLLCSNSYAKESFKINKLTSSSLYRSGIL